MVTHADYFLDTYTALNYHDANNRIRRTALIQRGRGNGPTMPGNRLRRSHGANAVKPAHGLNR